MYVFCHIYVYDGNILKKEEVVYCDVICDPEEAMEPGLKKFLQLFLRRWKRKKQRC